MLKKKAEWARQAIITAAIEQLPTINALVYDRCGLTHLQAAATGAMLLASSAWEHYAPCGCGNCDDVPATPPDTVRQQAHDMLDFYLDAQFLSQIQVEGTA